MWEAKAEYADGSSVYKKFADNGTNEEDQQYNIECWLLERHDNCVWYSVNWIEE